MADLELFSGVWAAAGRFVWHAATRTAVLADLHVGFEAMAHAAGNALPERTAGVLRAAWEAVLARRPERIVIAGDVFETPMPNARAVGLMREMIARVSAGCAVMVTRGNHDGSVARLAAALEGTRAEVVERATLPGLTVAHGDRLEGIGRPALLIVGHQHPAVVLRDRLQAAKMVCFAAVEAGVYGFPLVVLPAFSPVPLGTNLLTSRRWIVDLPAPEARRVRVAGIVRDAVLDFGPLAGLV